MQACQISETTNKLSLTLDYMSKAHYHSPATASTTDFFNNVSDLNFAQHMFNPSVQRGVGKEYSRWFSPFALRESNFLFVLGDLA